MHSSALWRRRLTYCCAQIGIHGIIIEFEDSNGNYYSATYLPDVASEQGWSHLEAVTSLMKKAGFRRSVSPAMLQKLKVTRYRSSKHKLTYQEYLAIKAQGLGQA
jgi:AMMECR1 domain-containing protein